MKSIIITTCLEFILVAVLLFGRFGFDHPGEFGLHFGHLMLFLICLGITTITGFILTIFKNKWLWFGIQLAILGTGLWIFYLDNYM